MKWSELIFEIENRFCESLKKRVSINSTAYWNCSCGLAWISLDKEIIANFCTRVYYNNQNGGVSDNGKYDNLKNTYGELSRQDIYEACWSYVHKLSIEELDLIWSEGSIYHIGFERVLNEWRKFLKIGGYIAITENTWFTEERPDEIQEFWHSIYPEIDTISNKVAQMQKAGYLPVATYMLPETIWTDYYSMQSLNIDNFMKKHKGNKTAEEFATSQRYEAELYYKYKAYYGYMFYIGKRIK